MFAIPKTPAHPAEDAAARERLRAVVCGPLKEAWGAWFDVLCRLGRDPGDGEDEYYDEVTGAICELEKRLTCGREDYPSFLEMFAHGDIVPMFGVDGTPVLQDGEQMHANRGAVYERSFEEVALAMHQKGISSGYMHHLADQIAIWEAGGDPHAGLNSTTLPKPHTP